jgi:tetratricopeptide (TPR) repeat protein
MPYMAPEQLRLMASRAAEGSTLAAPETSEASQTSEVCGSTRADPRSDLFSLGVILYEVLTGVLPFGSMPRGRSLEDTARRLLDQQARGPQPLREKNPRVDRRLAQSIEQCLALDPDRRPQSAAALAEALRRELTPVRRARRWVRDHRKPVSAALLTVLAAVMCWGAFLAIRPAYHVRQLRRGLEYLEQGRYELAVECFDSAIRAAPEDSGKAMLARGKARLKLNDPRAAFEDFRAVQSQEPSAAAAAGVGYCLSQLRYPEEAIEAYRMAVSMGNRSAAILNNLGYSCRKLQRFEEAEAYLKEATQLDGQLQAAHYNLAALYLERAFKENLLAPAAQFHVSKAIEIGPPSAGLYETAAHLCMFAAGQDADAGKRALDYLEKGHSLGLNVTTLMSISHFRPLRDLQPFQRLVATPPTTKPTPPVFLLDPL